VNRKGICDTNCVRHLHQYSVCQSVGNHRLCNVSSVVSS
jgi:hypothetical protein